MKQNEAQLLADNLVAKFGLLVTAELTNTPDGQVVVIIPSDIPRNNGFSVKVLIGWRSLIMDFQLGKFGGDILLQMSQSSVEQKNVFCDVAKEILKDKGKLQLKINEGACDVENFEHWPTQWKSFTFSLTKSALEINADDFALSQQLINKWVERFYGCILSLLPLDEIEDNIELTGMPEGAVIQTLVNRYERSRYNRTLCINFHGYNCKVCEVNLGEVYDSIGEGYIHVHHVVPVSQIGMDYLINPIKDLIPVCPNCHAMLHRQNPPYSVQQLKGLIKNKKKSDAHVQ